MLVFLRSFYQQFALKFFDYIMALIYLFYLAESSEGTTFLKSSKAAFKPCIRRRSLAFAAWRRCLGQFPGVVVRASTSCQIKRNLKPNRLCFNPLHLPCYSSALLARGHLQP